MNLNFLFNNFWIILAVAVWELIWKGMGLWQAAKDDEKYWFAAILFINTAGLLPIGYLLYKYSQNKRLKSGVI